MRYIDRDRDGNVEGVFMREQHPGQEQVSADNEGVTAFYKSLESDPDEAKIQGEIDLLTRTAAIESLKDKGELSIDYKSPILEV